MPEQQQPAPAHYRWAVVVLLKFAMVMLIIGLLSGIAFQESSKRFVPGTAPGDPSFWDVALHLALVHGHILVTGVVLPVVLAAMLQMGWTHGGAEIGRRGLRFALFTYLPFVSLTLCLMLYKGYHVLLSARGGQTDLAAINAGLFGGATGLRHAVYGLAHAGMAVGLGVFVWCLWRSLRRARR